jgi:hypothetical protein
MYERTTWPRAARFGGVAEIYREIREQLVAARLAVVTGFVLAAVLLGAVVFIHFWRGTSFAAFMRDPAAHVGAPAYVGAISHIGIIMWAAAAAICLFSAWTIWRWAERTGQHAERDREDVRFLGWSGLGTLYLALDDVMLLHEDIIIRLTGLSEEIILVTYIAVFALYLVRFRRAILRAEYALFLIALCFLGLMVVQDAFLPYSDVQLFFEDGAKLIAIIFWLIFFARTGAAAVGRRMMAISGGRGQERVGLAQPDRT